MEKSLIVCGIVRDAERGLKHNMPVMAKLAAEFSSFTMIIFENDSKDRTKALLEQWKLAMGDKLVVVSMDTNAGRTIPKHCEVNSNPYYSSRRITRMVALRNQYMQYIDDHHLEADYLMVVDLDVAGFKLEDLMSSFNLSVEWDAVCANCFSLSPRLKRRYHDTYALTEFGDEANPQTEFKIRLLSEKYSSLKGGDELVRVFSAFGGIAIYRFNAIRGLKYQLILNDDPRVEVRCEHYSIFKQMAERGYTHCYINPNMRVKYRKITLKIVLNSIKRNIFGN